MKNRKDRKDWTRVKFGLYVSSDGWTAEYMYSRSGYVCYKVKNELGQVVSTGGILGLDGKNIGERG